MQQISDHDLIPFNFEGVKLQKACWIKGEPYFTRKAIGEFLEYKRPQWAIDKIIKSNPLHQRSEMVSYPQTGGN